MSNEDILICIDNTGYDHSPVVTPALDTPYTIRQIIPKGSRFFCPEERIGVVIDEDCIYLNEIVNNIVPLWNIEPFYPLADFMVLNPPMADVIEHIKENTIETPMAPALV